ncbi:hypothetical protein [Candidatus Reidiella endopervernicosa]|uniref:Acyltransferase n=1 Tax=Candidatus Reidiella endopervernicosa TaxID=2738883 RepID=A0A6N0HZ98_9GAMM|nr:hypothetical protein [Candidatus Reidiella endopervernicosa]QKQ27665.1 hypothetical protein HUE57_16215 [Candidatus Reidiella endopervernicosa]
MSVDKPGFGDYTYIQGIDGLRAIAVLAVMLFHIDASLLPGGFAGVDLFCYFRVCCQRLIGEGINP